MLFFMKKIIGKEKVWTTGKRLWIKFTTTMMKMLGLLKAGMGNLNTLPL